MAAPATLSNSSLNARRRLVADEGLRQVRDEIVGVLDADGQADRRLTYADAGAQLGGYARVRRRAGVAGEGLRSSQADGKLEDLQPVEASERFRQPALDIE